MMSNAALVFLFVAAGIVVLAWSAVLAVIDIRRLRKIKRTRPRLPETDEARWRRAWAEASGDHAAYINWKREQ